MGREHVRTPCLPEAKVLYPNSIGSGGDLLAQHPNRVLAVTAGQGHEFIEDPGRWD